MDQKETGEPVLEEELLSPYNYFTKIKGEQSSLKLFFTFNHWLQVPNGKLTALWDITDKLFCSISMFDDIQDDAKVRAVLPAAHCVYGVPLTMNASLHTLLLVLKKTSMLCPEGSKVIVESFLELMRGQGTELYWRQNFICPTEEQYLEMSKKKTGSFCLMIIKLMQLFSKDKRDYSNLVYILATYFQIHDDYCNLNNQEGLDGWPEENDSHKVYKEIRFCEDITEGKFSFPIVHAMQTKYREEILKILRQRTQDKVLKEYCLAMLEKAGSFQYTRSMMTTLDTAARTEVARLGGNPQLIPLLDRFLTWKT